MWRAVLAGSGGVASRRQLGAVSGKAGQHASSKLPCGHFRFSTMRHKQALRVGAGMHGPHGQCMAAKACSAAVRLLLAVGLGTLLGRYPQHPLLLYSTSPRAESLRPVIVLNDKSLCFLVADTVCSPPPGGLRAKSF